MTIPEREDDLAYLVGLVRATTTLLRELADDLQACGLEEKAKLCRHTRTALAHAAKRLTRHTPPVGIARRTGEWQPPVPAKPPAKK